MRRTSAALATVTLALAAAAPAAARTHYVVRYGDTLTGIARARGITLERLARLNHRRPYAILREGTVLVVPGGRTQRGRAYTVRWGDTLTGIGARFGIGVDRLARANHLSRHGVLLAGTTLRLPGGHAGHGGYAADSAAATACGPATRSAASPPASASGCTGSPARTACASVGSCSPGSRCACGPITGQRSPPAAPGLWSVAASIDSWSAHYGVDARLARAVAWQESGFHINIFSPAGAWGPVRSSRAPGHTSRTA